MPVSRFGCSVARGLSSVHVERVDEGLVLLLLGALHGLAEFLFEQPLAVLERAQLLLEELLALLLLLVQALEHFVERGYGLGLLFVGDERARLRVNRQRRFAAGAD